MNAKSPARRASCPALLPDVARRLLLALGLAVLFTISMGTARAADALTPDLAQIDASLDGIRKNINAVQQQMQGKPDDTTLIKLRASALDAASRADKAAALLNPALTSVQARLAELGAAPDGIKEPADVAAQRAQLTKASSQLDAQAKLAGLLSVEAEQVAAQVSVLRRNRFQQRLGERTAAILAPDFWNELADDLPQDIGHVTAFGKQLRDAAKTTPTTVWVLVALSILGIGVLRIVAARLLLNLTATKVPPGRLRRSLHAVTVVALTAATPALIGVALLTGLRWNSPLPDETMSFLLSALGLISFGGYIAGLGQALLLPARPTWRLLPLSDALARRMRGFPSMLAVVIVLVWLSERLSVLVNAGLATTVAVNCITALLLSLTITFWLLRGARKWRQLRSDPANPQPLHAFWLRGIIVLQWLILVFSLCCLLTGYVALGSFVVRQVAWTLIVLSSCYLLAVLIDDICTSIGSAAEAQDAADGTAPAASASKIRDQAAVLLSGAARLVLVLIAFMLLAAPFGETPVELMHRADRLHDGVSIGEIAIKPGAVLQALLVLGLSLLAVRVFKHWLETRYLPTTRLDSGMQTSASTLFGYVGSVLAVALAMSAVGIGLERIAWVASALSVGIGFGLQAVVQNFVSGLILLAERPVKVGDWVSLGGVEGDIRRINVRATEIQMSDRSTVIVPNSEFITKTVRNVTHTNPLGLVQIKLPLPLATDAAQARELLLASFQAHPNILDTPAPNVQLDGIDGSNLMFNATGYVASPRMSYGVRSELLFDMLKRLADANIAISKPSTMVLTSIPLTTAAAPPAAADAAPPA